jgi:hypothetical protein
MLTFFVENPDPVSVSGSCLRFVILKFYFAIFNIRKFMGPYWS